MMALQYLQNDLAQTVDHNDAEETREVSLGFRFHSINVVVTGIMIGVMTSCINSNETFKFQVTSFD